MEPLLPIAPWLVALAVVLGFWLGRRRRTRVAGANRHGGAGASESDASRARVAELRTRVAELEAELATIRDQQEALDQRQRSDDERRLESHRQLVADVSHEFKTPLTAIRGYTETLYDGALESPETARRFLGRTLEQCERLEALLRDLLTLSRLDAGQALHNTRTLDLISISRHILEVLEPRAIEARVKTTLDIGSPPPPKVRADPDHAERLLLNLVENAIKYNRAGGSVAVSLARVDGGAEIEVRDTGLGIPDDDLDRIFERFYRVDRGRTRRDGGSGLGLAIVSQLVHDLGGHIHVESRLGQGSIFRVILPAADSDSPSPPQ